MLNTSEGHLRGQLEAAFGPLMSGEALWRTLGFTTAASFHHASSRGLVPVDSFRLPRRKGRFARTADVSAWLSAHGIKELAALPSKTEATQCKSAIDIEKT